MKRNERIIQKALLLTCLLIVGLSSSVLAQGPPPPPGVPLDFGISLFVAGCVGYGAVSMKNKDKK